MIKVTPELIEKYHLGLCSDEERDAVENWLLNTEDEISDLSERALEKMEANIWKNVTAEQAQARHRSYVFPLKKMMRYAAVACVGAMAILATGYAIRCDINWMNTELAFDNTNGQTTKYLHAGAIDLRVFPQSKIFTSTNLCGSSVAISFCGNHKIQNTSKQEVKLSISSPCNTTFTIVDVSLRPKGKCALYTGRKGKNYLVKNNDPFSLPPAEWQRYRSLFLVDGTKKESIGWS
ncbi:hypothetical protein QQ020_34875 [Fulvivirgaceae bacterium BMA12]|uniref:DUF4179 domain-containing protein n=1 Tax=Agaribacillus aureus TaxID=3051825 RepID=A0ABT8LKR5_9BACT|nr:hypothetical protein [Fulvivirgaceae bacterium BMA12]